jgi:hypothetical protein
MQQPPTYGTAPALVGAKLDALLCEAFIHRGKLQANANAVFLLVGGNWWRLALDAGTIHWRIQNTAPEPWSVPASGWSYPHTDVGEEANLVGHKVEYVRSGAEGAVARVELGFSNGKRFIVSNMNDSTSYFVA